MESTVVAREPRALGTKKKGWGVHDNDEASGIISIVDSGMVVQSVILLSTPKIF